MTLDKKLKYSHSVPLSTQEYKWVSANNCWGNLTECWGVTCDGLASHPGEINALEAHFMLLRQVCLKCQELLGLKDFCSITIIVKKGHCRP